MKTQAARYVLHIDDDDEDDDFLAQVAAAEAQALANKRRRIAIAAAPSPNFVVVSPPPPSKAIRPDGDGDLYTAALKGSQSVFSEAPRRGGFGRGRGGVAAAGSDDGVSSGDACFKCGKSGHWARDCNSPGGGGFDGNYGGGDSSIPEKSCSCGSGTCLVLTANTEKNRGRKFYKCPIRQENGGCNFFEWCDNNASGPNAMAGGGNGSSFSRVQNYAAADSSFPALECPCGGGQCRILTAKKGNNIGRQFYRCPANEESSCGFFKWCNEPTATAGSAPGVRVPNVSYGSSEAFNQGSFGVKSGSSCYKCGKDGHWARDCSVPLNNAPVEFGGRSAPTSTCYKCGTKGHWARDCPSG